MFPRRDGSKCSHGATGQITSLVYINIIVFVCLSVSLSVCLSVCLFVPKLLLGKLTNMDILYTNRSTIYLERMLSIYEIYPIKCPVAIGRKPDTGRSKPAKNALFLEVFGEFDTLPYTVFNPNFKRR